MRKLSVLMLLAALALSPMSVDAKGKDWPMQNPGGFSGPVSGAMADTIARAQELPDGAPVVLTGSLVSQIAGKKDKFLFKDQSGEVVVDIDKKAFRGRTITPADTIRVSGKVDKDWGKDLEIDVKQIEIVAQ